MGCLLELPLCSEKIYTAYPIATGKYPVPLVTQTDNLLLKLFIARTQNKPYFFADQNFLQTGFFLG
jgi:hypothetical protein